MKIESLHIGMKVKHPQYGAGEVRALSAATAEVRFGDGIRTVDPVLSGLSAAEPQVAISGLEMPLGQLVAQTVESVAHRLGLERAPDNDIRLAPRWHGGRLVLHPGDPALQTKEVPLEVFFHKVVMVRNQLRVLEQKINAHEGLNDAEKVEFQQYVTRCYGSMTTFNVLFKDKEDQF